MIRRYSKVSLLALTVIFSAILVQQGNAQTFAGNWIWNESQSKNADFFDGEAMWLKISPQVGNDMTLDQIVKTEYDTRSMVTKVSLNGPETRLTWPKGDLPVFGYEAVAIGNDQTVMCTAVQGEDKSSFDLTLHLNATVSQGFAEVELKSHYQLSTDGDTLTITTTRDTRGSGEPVVYVFDRTN